MVRNGTETEKRTVRYRLLAGPCGSDVFEKEVPRLTSVPHRIVVATGLNGGEHHEMVFTRDASREGRDGVMNFALSDCYRVADEDGAPEYYAPRDWIQRACRCTWEGMDDDDRVAGS